MARLVPAIPMRLARCLIGMRATRPRMPTQSDCRAGPRQTVSARISAAKHLARIAAFAAGPRPATTSVRCLSASLRRIKRLANRSRHAVHPYGLAAAAQLPERIERRAAGRYGIPYQNSFRIGAQSGLLDGLLGRDHTMRHSPWQTRLCQYFAGSAVNGGQTDRGFGRPEDNKEKAGATGPDAGNRPNLSRLAQGKG